ncbi:DUF4153 domain-containing protein [Paenibacillus mendelii]|uniref:DUF4153 domain-containing protein n=1 Tax=Paenibacillus mendelii TaxID=206163 RepID=A0ABV6JG89_9BACL|nr:DUF4173 domain-containing protein [Paenibacillus mendelii]MCQ6557776.1 DUF4173 domain-containing protein [Paenibacillus mendelii]
MWILALALGIVSQYLFVGNAAGISVVIFILGFYGLFFYAANGRMGGFDKWQGQSRSGWLLMVPIGLLVMTYAIFANRFFHLLNGVAIMILVAAQTILLTRSGSQPWHKAGFFPDLVHRCIVKPFTYVSVPFGIVSNLVLPSEGIRTARGTLRKVSLGLLLAAPILIVVIALLASADRIFQSWLTEIPGWFQGLSVGEGVVRVMTAGGIALYTFCYIWGLLVHKPADSTIGSSAAVNSSNSAEGNEAQQKAQMALDPISAGTLLISVNLVYILFAVIQFSYLFGAANGLLPEGAAYAEYARRGFTELVLVALINLVLLLCGLHFVRREGVWMERVRKVSLSMLVICTVIMLVSAYSRLSLYEDAYGYTQTRLLAHGFMLFLGVLLVTAFIRIWQERLSLSKAYICCAVIAYVVMNYVNLDARIASNNIARYERTGIIDIAYLGTLSADAAPALLKLQEKQPDIESLNQVVDQLKERSRSRDQWPSWNLSEQRLR